jgi:hypothetical protein
LTKDPLLSAPRKLGAGPWRGPREHGDALDAAHAVAPDRPVVAYLLEHDLESRGRAERAGPSLQWRGPDAGNPDPAAVRLVYADRPLDPALLEQVTALA